MAVDVLTEIIIARSRDEVAAFAANLDGGTRMTLRNRGTPAGFSRFAAPFMAWAMRRANRKDLWCPKNLLEK